MKSASREWLLRSLILVAGFGGGWAFFQSSAQRNHPAAATVARPASGGSRPVTSRLADPQNQKAPSDAGSPAASESQESVRARFEAALRLPNPRRRLAAFLRQLDSLTGAEAPALQQLILDLYRSDGLEATEEWAALLQRWGELDGGAAATDFLGNSGEPWVGWGLEHIMSGWASKEPAAAAAWLNAHADNPHFDQALKGIVMGMAEKDPEAATQVALSSLPEGNRTMASNYMELLAETVVHRGKTPAMLEWFEALPVDANGVGIKNAAFGHVWWRLKSASMEEAAAWLASNAAQPWRNDRQYGETTAIMAQKDPVAALDWAGSLPPSPVDGRWPGVSATLGEWAQRTPPPPLPTPMPSRPLPSGIMSGKPMPVR